MMAELEDILDIYDGSSDICKKAYNQCFSQIMELDNTDESQYDMDFWMRASYEHLRNRLFPESFAGVRRELEEGIEVYISTLERLLAKEAEQTHSPVFCYEMVNDEELRSSRVREEYTTFLEFCERMHLFAFMRLGIEVTPYSTSCHIAGVHHVAMTMARQLRLLGVDVDLAMVSASSISHDLGKYGCREKEIRNVPYLHYYYTDKCLSQNNMKRIAYIAANHSTWDLELEDLSVESLLLIYADFRVKGTKKDGREMTAFYSLAESFDVILGKLDNVDDAKRRRYVHVYNRLKDFETYMVSLGVDTEIPDDVHFESKVGGTVTGVPKPFVFMNIDEAVVFYRNMAIDHNIRLMAILSDETDFGRLIESSRSEKDWHGLRSYIQIFKEYHTYMNQSQKLVVLKFLFELLIHREGDIRRESAILMGEIIISYDKVYRKAVPTDTFIPADGVNSKTLFEKYAEQIAAVDYRVNERLKNFMGNVLGNFVLSIIENCREGTQDVYLHILIRVLERNLDSTRSSFFIINALRRIPLDECPRADLLLIFKLAEKCMKKNDRELRLAVLVLTDYILQTTKNREYCEGLARKLLKYVSKDTSAAVLYLADRIAGNAHLASKRSVTVSEAATISSVFRENLKTATPWIYKEINVEMLTRMFSADSSEINRDFLMQTSTHFANLLTVSASSIVRRKAGAGLIELSCFMNKDQQNELAIELLHGLSLGEFEFSKYVPGYLGVIINRLEKSEYEEFIDELEKLLITANDKTACLALDTIGVVLENTRNFKENHERLCGLILKGLSSFHAYVAEEALYVIGSIFSSHLQSSENKADMFGFMYKKLLDMLNERREEGKLTDAAMRQMAGRKHVQGGAYVRTEGTMFYINASVLNHIYRFLSDYLQDKKKIKSKEYKRAVFFPGTFDPFTISHKEIALEMRNMGFEVYLAVDEFSWSKKTQPNLVRRKLAEVSTAAEGHIYMFPKDIPVNIASTDDLRQLKRFFARKELYIATGSDVVENASAYRRRPSRNTIHSLNHIIFLRHSSLNSGSQPLADDDVSKYSSITGKVITLKLPVNMEDISSSRIRADIDSGHDISGMVDDMARRYIYENSLYLREPQNKPIVAAGSLKMSVVKNIDRSELLRMHARFSDAGHAMDFIDHFDGLSHINAAAIYDGSVNDELRGFCAYAELKHSELMKIFKDINVSSLLRQKTPGKLLLICALYTDTDAAEDYAQLLLTEVLSEAAREEFCFAVSYLPGECDSSIFCRQGFVSIDAADRLLVTDMRCPCALISNIAMEIKEPFNTNCRVMETIKQAHRRLQSAFNRLYPGQLILSVDSGIMHHRLVEKIAAANGVPSTPTIIRRLGDKICVPYGRILKGHAVPNTVTKTLHTEKVYRRDIDSFRIAEYPGYLTLEEQLRTIKSFGRRVILVDDLLHKGYRLQKLTPILKSSGIEVSEIIVGILTGRGKDLAAVQDLPVRSAYYIPNMRSWFCESALYPFIGGDSVESGRFDVPGMLTSINMILPYMLPHFMRDCDRRSFYEFSMVCLENARSIMLALEEEYQREYERSLTLDRLSEVILSPTLPDKGISIKYNSRMQASVYIESEIESLVRLKSL